MGEGQKPLSLAIEEVCHRTPNAAAIMQRGEVPVSFSNILYTIHNFADKLLDHGVRAGDVVAAPVVEPIAVITMKLALIRIGATPIAVGNQDVANDVVPGVNYSVVPPDFALGHAKEILFQSDWIGPPKRLVPYAGGGSIVHATSGTTGIPKLRADDEETFFARIRNGIQTRGECDGPVFVAHNAGSLIGLKSCVTALLSGQFQVPMLDGYARTLAMLRDLGIVHAFVPPVLLRQLVETAEREKIRPNKLRRINAGGSPISASFAAQCEDVFGCEVYNDYGSTETDTIATHRPSTALQTPGVAGRIFPVFGVRFVDDAFQEVPPTEGGELLLKLPEGMQPRDYPSMDRLSDAEGWVSTGDFGHIDAEGLLVLKGRKFDLINIGGNKMAPQIFERMLDGSDAFTSMAAFRIPTDTGIDDVGIAVVPANGFTATDIHQTISAMADDFYVFHVLELDEIPLTQAGKTDRAKLLDMYRNSQTE